MEIQQELIKACIKGDRRAEHQLFTLSYSYLISICFRYTRHEDRAREIFNMGFYRILKNLAKYDPKMPFKPWARVIMVNVLINEYRKEKTHYSNLNYIEDYVEDTDFSELNEGLEKFDASYIYGFIADLPLATQHVFNLHIDGYPHKDIAALLGINESTSRWHLTSAKARLRKVLQNYNTKKESLL